MSKVFIRLKEKGTGRESNEISIEELIYNQSKVEFKFPDIWDYKVISYEHFLNFRDDYKVIVSSKIWNKELDVKFCPYCGERMMAEYGVTIISMLISLTLGLVVIIALIKFIIG